MSISTLRVLLGFLIAPGMPALMLYWLNRGLAQQAPELLSIILAMLGYPAAIVVGVPAYLWLSRKGVFTFRACLTGGALVGLIFYVLYFAFSELLSYQPSLAHLISSIRKQYMSAVLAVGYSSAASVFFGLIAVRGRAGYDQASAKPCTQPSV